MQLRKFACCCLPILAFTIVAAAGNGFEVHVERVADHRAAGKPARVVVSARAESLSDPVRWEVAVFVARERVLRFVSTDNDIDSGFHEPNFVGGCSSYEDCKLRWYLAMPRDVIVNINARTDPRIVDENWPGSLFSVARNYLVKKCGLEPEEATRIVNRLADGLRSGDRQAISLPLTPAADGPLLIYVPEVKGFVPLRETEIELGR